MRNHDTDARTPFAPVIRTQTDLEAVWRHLIRPLRFARTSLWLMMIQDDGVPLPQLVEVVDCPASPTRADADQLAAMLAHLPTQEPDAPSDPAGRWAVLRCRPGRTAVDDDARAWAAMLHAACIQIGVRLAPLHVADDHDIHPVPLDELRGVG